MPFPVVAGAESFGAGGKCAAVRAGVAFHVFSERGGISLWLQVTAVSGMGRAYLKSHSRVLILPHSVQGKWP